jgi:hypothetical protein
MSGLKFRSRLTLLLLLAAGCAHAVPDSSPVRDPGTPVLVRYADPEDAVVARQLWRALRAALPVAERWGTLRTPVTITIHATHAELETAARQPGFAWLRAWARLDSIELQSPRTWSSGMISDAEMEQLLAHELTHCAMYQSLPRDPAVGRSVPIWFREGMATVAAGERHTPPAGGLPGGRGALALAAAASVYRTESSLVYATADAAFRLLVERHGDESIRRVLIRMRAGDPFAEAFRGATGVTVDAFEAEFRRSLGRGGNEG